MSLQTKNLKTLTSHQDRMSEIYQDDKAGAQSLGYQRPQMQRHNSVFQNQQISRIEKELDKTSRQLQAEIAQITSDENNIDILTEEALNQIDQLFTDAENYF